MIDMKMKHEDYQRVCAYIFIASFMMCLLAPIGYRECYSQHAKECAYNPECCNNPDCDGSFRDFYSVVGIFYDCPTDSIQVGHAFPALLGLIFSLIVTVISTLISGILLLPFVEVSENNKKRTINKEQ